MVNVLVTGGAGFLGSNFVNKSLHDKPNLNITVLDSLTYAGSLEHLKPVLNQIDFIKGDIRDLETVRTALKNQDLVVHFAAESHNDNSLKNPDIFIQTNINGTFNLISTAAEFGIRFHHISTDEVYGDLPLNTDERFTEDRAYRPSSPYSASKAASDLIVKAWVRSFDLQATISNCSNNYGPNQNREKFIPNTIQNLIQGKRPPIYGDGKNVRDWIHVDDHTAGIWAVIEKGKIGETYLLGANNERSNMEVIAAILKEFNLPDDFYEFVTDRKGHDLRYAIDPTKANRELGWVATHTNFEKNIKALVELYRN
jgi:dTDP-glucose 4,6-dehydratase